MSKIKQVLTIAGSDSGGGAGIQADLKTFQEKFVFGTSVVTAVTAQNTKGIQDVHPVFLNNVQAQLDSTFEDFSISAIKTGMLVNEKYVELIANKLKNYSSIPLIVDPVMVAKGGRSLMENTATKMLIKELLPLATLVTPNIPEAEAITNIEIKTEDDMIEAAKIIRKLGGEHVLIKGGHQDDNEYVSDLLLLDNGEVRRFQKKRVDTKNTHGTGCTYAASITAEIAKGYSVEQAVAISKEFIHSAIKNSLNIGSGHGPTNHFAHRDEGQSVGYK